MSQREHDAVETNETSESNSPVEQAASLSAGVWDDMRRGATSPGKDFKPAPPDGVEVINPWMTYFPAFKAEQEGRLQIDDQGNRFVTPDGNENQPTEPVVARTTLSSTVFTNRRDDGSIEAVSASFDKQKEKHDISLNSDGSVKDVTVTTADGKSHRVQGEVITGRSDDGSLSYITFTDGEKTHIYGFDPETKEVAEVQTREGNRLIRRTIAEGGETSNTEEVRDEKNDVVEEYSRDANQYTAKVVHPDRTEQVSINKAGVVTTNQSFNDGQSILNIQAPNGDFSFTHTDAGGNTLKRTLLRGYYTVEYTDTQGNWMKQVTDQVTGKTRHSHGDRDGNVIEGPETSST